MTGVDELVAFIRARLDEDERASIPNSVMYSGGPPGPWVPNCVGPTGTGCPVNWRIAAPDPEAERAHRLTHQTDRQRRDLRGVEAKRRILDEFDSAARWADDPHCPNPSHYRVRAGVLLEVIRWDAAEWADHPDFREEWRA